MSLRRPASGRRVGGGTLRVDAARAIAKLRDYQLSEPTAWILEGIRAAVASGATRIDLQGDSNDVWLAWHGEAWPGESLPILLDELVSPASAKEGQKLRLLGTAVNSALGLRPSYIDVYRIADGVAEKVRYEASLLDEQKEESSELVRPTLDSVPIPKRAGGAAMFIHFRRRFGLEPLRNLLAGQPPEMRIARAACGDLAIPIVIGNDELGAHMNTTDLIRVEIGQNVSGFLALMDSSATPAENQGLMQVAEHGVHIVSYALDLTESGMPLMPPIRLLIDSDRMPTNASRSEVRRTAHPLNTAEKQLPRLYQALCKKIAAELVPDAETDPLRRSLLERSAMALLASFIAGTGWSRQARNLQDPFQQLTELPLLKNAIGETRAPKAYWDESVVYTGEEALPLEMAPWFNRVLWRVEGAPSALLVPTVGDTRDFHIRLRNARREIKARKRFEKHDPREAKFDRVPAHWVRAPLAADLADTAMPYGAHRFEGEVYLAPGKTNATITILLGGREIEEVDLDLSPLPFRAIVEGATLTPEREYRSVVRDEHYKTVQRYVLSAAIRCVEALCRDGAEGFSRRLATSRDERAALVRAALVALTKLGREIASDSTLANVDAWQLADGTMVSLAALRTHAAVGRVATRELRSIAPPARPTVILASRDVDNLRALLGNETALVSYGRAALPLRTATAKSIARTLCNQREGVAAFGITEEHARGAIAWGLPGTNLWISHRSQELATHSTTQLSTGATISIDDDRVIPAIGWQGVEDDADLLARDFKDWTTAMVRAFAKALLGRPPKNFITNAPLSLTEGPGVTFVATLLREVDVSEVLGEVYDALRAAPLFTVLGNEKVSADDLARDYPVAIDYLQKSPSVRVDLAGWKPLIASRSVANFASKLSGSGRRDGTKKLQRKIVEAQRRVNEALHRTKATVALASRLATSPATIEYRFADASGLLSIGSDNGTKTYIDLEILVEGRPFQRIREESRLPFAAVLEVSNSRVDATFHAVQPKVHKRLLMEIRAAALPLIEEKLDKEPTALASDWRFRSFTKTWLNMNSNNPARIKRVRERVQFTDQRGQSVALSAALVGNAIRISTYAAEPWLEADEGQSRHKWDEPVLTFAEDSLAELTPILEYLLDGPIVVTDVSESLRALQIARRIEQGLLLAPSVPVDAALKRPLTDLIPSEKIGEIGFHNASSSVVRVFQQGEESSREPLELFPPVIVAIEDSSLADFKAKAWTLAEALHRQAELKSRVEQLTIKLIASVLKSKTPLPDWVGSQLSHALCLGHIAVDEIPGLASTPLFRTTSGVAICWDDLARQVELFEDVWHTREGDRRLPIDPQRLVLVLPQASRLDLSTELNFVDGEEELALDEIAARNQQQAPVDSLSLSPAQEEAAVTTMQLSNSEGLRGVVAPLFPQAIANRGVVAHREMKPIGTALDPCTWPTLAIIDAPQLSPNRTWEAPLMDESWQLAAQAIVKASDHALIKAMPPPEGILTSHWVGRKVEAAEPKYRERGVSIRGRLWLTDSTEFGSIKIQLPGKEITYSPHCYLAQGDRFPLPVHGTLLCHAPGDFDSSAAIKEVVDVVYPHLLRQTARLKNSDVDLQAAQLAIGLASKHIAPDRVKKVKFSCFSPAPLDAVNFLALLSSSRPLELREAQAESTPSLSLSFDKDESELSRVIEGLFAGRITRATPPVYDSIDVEIDIGSDSDVEMDSGSDVDSEVELDTLEDIVDEDLGLQAYVDAPEVEVHVLQSLAQDLYRQIWSLELNLSYDGVIVDAERKKPMLAFEEQKLILAGRAPTLLALQASHNAGDPTFEGCLQLLCAHALTLLNEGYTSVTDSAEARSLVTLLRVER